MWASCGLANRATLVPMLGPFIRALIGYIWWHTLWEQPHYTYVSFRRVFSIVSEITIHSWSLSENTSLMECWNDANTQCNCHKNMHMIIERVFTITHFEHVITTYQCCGVTWLRLITSSKISFLAFSYSSFYKKTRWHHHYLHRLFHIRFVTQVITMAKKKNIKMA